MRPSANFALHAVIPACLVALAASSAAAQGTPTLRIVTETPMAAKGDKPRIAVLELQAFKWGTTEDSANLGSWSKADGLAVTWDVAEAGRVNKVDGLTVKQQAVQDPKQHGEWIADVERPAEQGSYAPGNTKYSSVKLSRAEPGASSAPNETLTDGGNRTESGLPTGKRQHKPFVLTKPLDKGSVWIRVASPWTACRVGMRYPALELSDGSRNYRLEGVSVANCGRSGAQAEEVAFHYNRIAFNYSMTK